MLTIQLRIILHNNRKYKFITDGINFGNQIHKMYKKAYL